MCAVGGWSEVVGNGFKGVFSEFITVKVAGIEGMDLIYGTVEGYAAAEGCEYIGDGFGVGVRDFVAVEDECG